MKRKAKSALDPRALLATVGAGRTTRDWRKNQTIFSQGDRADVVFFVDRGKVKLTVLSRQAKQAVIGILGPGSFFGEGCLAGHPPRMATARCSTSCCTTDRRSRSVAPSLLVLVSSRWSILTRLRVVGAGRFYFGTYGGET